MHDHPIKTRTDGSIDTAYYMSRGRRERSQAAHGVMGSLRRRVGSLVRW